MLRTLIAAVLACALTAALAPAAHATDSSTTMLRAINSYRAANDVAPLRASSVLERSARSYARELAARGEIAHMGIAPSTRFRSVGENLEWHSGSQVAVRRALRSWIASPPHRSVLLSRQFRWAGAAPARGTILGTSAVVWVLHVGGR